MSRKESLEQIAQHIAQAKEWDTDIVKDCREVVAGYIVENGFLPRREEIAGYIAPYISAMCDATRDDAGRVVMASAYDYDYLPMYQSDYDKTDSAWKVKIADADNVVFVDEDGESHVAPVRIIGENRPDDIAEVIERDITHEVPLNSDLFEPEIPEEISYDSTCPECGAESNIIEGRAYCPECGLAFDPQVADDIDDGDWSIENIDLDDDDLSGELNIERVGNCVNATWNIVDMLNGDVIKTASADSREAALDDMQDYYNRHYACNNLLTGDVYTSARNGREYRIKSAGITEVLVERDDGGESRFDREHFDDMVDDSDMVKTQEDPLNVYTGLVPQDQLVNDDGDVIEIAEVVPSEHIGGMTYVAYDIPAGCEASPLLLTEFTQREINAKMLEEGYHVLGDI